MNEQQNMIEARDLRKTYGRGASAVLAVDGVSFSIARGEILGLVGESGCGKSTLGRLLLRLEALDRGSVSFDGQDITNLSFNEMRKIRNRMQMIFQGSSNAFNPHYTVRQIIAEPLKNYLSCSDRELEGKITAMLAQVGLGPEYLERFSSELSGGQRQRVGIARALVLKPEFVVCDEAVSSVDFALKKQILKMLAALRRKEGYACLFISHDIAAVKALCDRIMVMYLGRVVEILPSATAAARHPYTQALQAATLEPDPSKRNTKKVLFKTGGDTKIPERGCPFQPRCLYAREKCLARAPGLREICEGHFTACHLAQALTL